MKLVIVESPYAGDIPANMAYLQDCLRWCVLQGYSPYASHQMLTQALDDNDPADRQLGIVAGYEWWRVAEAIYFFTDLGWSKGMEAARVLAIRQDKIFRVVNLGDKGYATTHLNRVLARRHGTAHASAGVGQGY